MHPVRRPARLASLAAAGLAVAVIATACSSGASSIRVSGAWARASSAMAAAGAAYMTIENTGSTADALIGASSPAATTVEVHETVAMAPSAAPSGGMGGMESAAPSGSGMSGGMVGMQPVARLEIPAGATVELKPGSYHVMLIGLTGELAVGSTIEITLRFEKAGPLTVRAEVRSS